jgi:hypothetical protein
MRENPLVLGRHPLRGVKGVGSLAQAVADRDLVLS